MQFDWPIVGHRQNVLCLQRAVENNSGADAYIFIGPSQVGKRTVANLFANSLLCQQDSRPCKTCWACTAFAKGVHPDFISLAKLEDKTQINIEQVRNLINSLRKKSLAGGLQIAVINQANLLSNEAANALLKTLEEPSAKTKIILVADSDSLLATIKSRCQILTFWPQDRSQIQEFLLRNQVSPDHAEKIVSLAAGKIGLAQKMLADDFYDQTLQLVKQELNLIESNLAARLKYLDKTKNNEDHLQAKLEIWQTLIQEIICRRANICQTNLISEALLKNFDWPKIENLTSRLLNIPSLIKNHINLRLVWEDFYINI